MQGPTIERDGDSWSLAWEGHGIAMGFERLHEQRDGLRAEVTVESGHAGRVLGPVSVNILSHESQVRFAGACSRRVNSLKVEVWQALVVQGCAVVAKQYRAPMPVLNLWEVEHEGEVEYLVPGLVPTDETTVLYGDGESCKSLLALRIGASLVSGQILPWNERVTRTCPVLYLDWETNPRTVSLRLKRLAKGMFTQLAEFHYRQCFRSLDDELSGIREEISKRNIGLVIVDSIGFAAKGALVEDETARSAMNGLRQMSPATRLVLAHISAADARKEGGSARPFGSTFFWNGMRSGLELRRSEEGEDQDDISLGLFHRKANDGEHHKPIGMSVLFDGRTGPIGFNEIDMNDVPDLAARTTLSSRLRRLLRKGKMDTVELAEETQANPDSITRTLRRMTDVVRISDGGGRGKAAEWGLSE